MLQTTSTKTQMSQKEEVQL